MRDCLQQAIWRFNKQINRPCSERSNFPAPFAQRQLKVQGDRNVSIIGESSAFDLTTRKRKVQCEAILTNGRVYDVTNHNNTNMALVRGR